MLSNNYGTPEMNAFLLIVDGIGMRRLISPVDFKYKWYKKNMVTQGVASSSTWHHKGDMSFYTIYSLIQCLSKCKFDPIS